MKVKCPTCRKEIEWDTNNPFRPFCSERCKLIDLGAWLDDRMSIPECDGSDQTKLENLPKFIRVHEDGYNLDDN